MKSKIIFGFITMLLLVSMLSSVSAVQYFQQRSFINNDTTRVFGSISHIAGDGTDSTIKSGDPLELFVETTVTLKTWNINNPEFAVDHCNYTVTLLPHLSPIGVIQFNRTFEADEEERDFKQFIRLFEGDGMNANIDCVFTGNRTIETPADLTFVTPTWECKKCQAFEWTLLERDIAKAKSIGANTVEVGGFIKKLVFLNFEIVLAVFWLLLILISFVATSLIFVGLYWVFLYIRTLL